MDITVNATDEAGNVMPEESYHFYTEMRSFGKNSKVNSDTGSLIQDHPATAMDSAGDIWVVWDQTTEAGNTDIYIGKLTSGGSFFGQSAAVCSDHGLQSHPVIAVDSDDILYVAWQGHAVGSPWDIYVTSSADGTAWSDPVVVNFEDPNNESNQTSPKIAIKRSATDTIYIVCEDDRNGNKDIWVASSTNATSWTSSQITTDSSEQTEPAIIINNNVTYVRWTDARNASTDLYGASSENAWQVEGLIISGSKQSSIVLAADPVEEVVHEFWVDYVSGYADIFYKMDKILGTGTSIIDEPDTIQSQPTAAVVVSGSSSKVFAAWTDNRNLFNNNDTDIYFAERVSDLGFGTNVIVNDDLGTSSQSNPVVNVDINGNPYLVWVDERNGDKDIYFAGATYMDDPLPTTLEIHYDGSIKIQTTDIQIIIPERALPNGFDVNDITISKIYNPPNPPEGSLGLYYNLGPSGSHFNAPLTITISNDINAQAYVVYWYNPETGIWSQDSILNIQQHAISSSVHSVSFQTNHFTVFGIGAYTPSASGGGGGGCAMSQYPNSQNSPGRILSTIYNKCCYSNIYQSGRGPKKEDKEIITGRS